MSKFFSKPAEPPTAPSPSPVAGGTPDHTPGSPLTPLTQAFPSWPLGIQLDMHVYLSTSPTGDVFSKRWTAGYREDPDADLPHFVWGNITYGDWSDERVVEYDVNLPLVSVFLSTIYVLLTNL